MAGAPSLARPDQPGRPGHGRWSPSTAPRHRGRRLQPPWDEHHLETGEHTVSLELDSAASARTWNQGWTERGTGVILSFRVDDRDEVDRLCGVLVDAGATVMQPPYATFWGSRYAIVQDPDGNAVGLMSPPDPAHAGPPPDLYAA